MSKPTVYLAGPDVFYTNRNTLFKEAESMLSIHGFEALIPLDAEITNATDIFNANIKLIDRADYVLANLSAFRGKEPDSGTVFEVGYAYAKGKKVIGYTDIIDWGKHIGIASYTSRGNLCKDGYIVEDFGLPLNLMLSESIIIVNGDFDVAMKELIQWQSK